MKELYTAMAKAFPEIEGATKDKNNPAFRSKYADLGAVVDAIKPALVNNGLWFRQFNHEVTGGVCVETFVCHGTGQEVSFGKLFVPATKQDAQGYGSALTYARRYSLMTAFGVCPEDDDGNAAVKTYSKMDAAINAPSASPMVKGQETNPDWPAGPFKSVQPLKEFWRNTLKDEFELCGDVDQFDILHDKNKAALKQISLALPAWWTGEGLEAGQGIGEWLSNRRLVLLEKDAAGDEMPIAGDNGNTIIDGG